MKRGVIQSYDPQRDLGYIQPEGGGPKVLFSSRVVDCPPHLLRPGTYVQYEEGPEPNPTQRQATRVLLQTPVAAQSSPSSPSTPASSSSRSLPQECIFTDSFYNPSGYLREEIFYTGAQQAADTFRRAGLKSSQLRQIYAGFLSFAGPLREGRIPFEQARERFGAFYCERIVRQFQRGILPEVVKTFFDLHRNLILSSPQEMLAFFRYLTNIYCYFGESERTPERGFRR